MAYYFLSSGDLLNGKKVNILFFLSFAGVFAYFCSCVSGKTARDTKPPPYTWLTNSSKYILLPSKDIEHPLDMPQLISVSYENKDYFLNANRRILQGKTVIIEIEKTRNVVRFNNYLQGYLYTLEGNFEGVI